MNFEQPPMNSTEEPLEEKAIDNIENPDLKEIQLHIENCAQLDKKLSALRPESIVSGIQQDELYRIKKYFMNLKDSIVEPSRSIKELDDSGKRALIKDSIELEKTLTSIANKTKGEKISADDIGIVYEARLFIRDREGL